MPGLPASSDKPADASGRAHNRRESAAYSRLLRRFHEARAPVWSLREPWTETADAHTAKLLEAIYAWMARGVGAPILLPESDASMSGGKPRALLVCGYVGLPLRHPLREAAVRTNVRVAR